MVDQGRISRAKRLHRGLQSFPRGDHSGFTADHPKLIRSRPRNTAQGLLISFSCLAILSHKTRPIRIADSHSPRLYSTVRITVTRGTPQEILIEEPNLPMRPCFPLGHRLCPLLRSLYTVSLGVQRARLTISSTLQHSLDVLMSLVGDSGKFPWLTVPSGYGFARMLIV